MAVYFAENGPQGAIKIGHTAGNPHSRISTLQTGSPEEMTLLVSVPGGAGEEARLHKRFGALRIRGEWFRAESELVTFIEGLKWTYRDEQPIPDGGPDELLGLTSDQVLALRAVFKRMDATDRLHEAVFLHEHNKHVDVAERHHRLMEAESTHAAAYLGPSVDAEYNPAKRGVEFADGMWSAGVGVDYDSWGATTSRLSRQAARALAETEAEMGMPGATTPTETH